MTKRLYRSKSERMLFGVSGGIAEYFDFDPTLVRLAWVLGALLTGGAVILAYAVMALVTPEGGETGAASEDPAAADDSADRDLQARSTMPSEAEASRSGSGPIAGFVLVGVGVLFLGLTFGLFDGLFDWLYGVARFWPAVLIGVGLLLIARRAGRSNRGG